MCNLIWRCQLLTTLVIVIWSLDPLPLASAAPAKCDGVVDYFAWAECARSSGISHEERLNLVYKKVVYRLQGKVGTLNHLRDAQRRWISFREAQCAAEGFDPVTAETTSALASECFDRMAALRTDYLFSMLTGKDDELAYPKPASLSEKTRIGGAAKTRDAVSSGIPFESPDIIDKMKVSGLWFPEQIKPYVGLTGAAIFNFENVETGETFHAAVNGVALLPDGYWKSKGIEDLYQFSVSVLTEKVKASSPVKIGLSAEERAKVVNCSAEGGNAENATAPPDKCLHFGSAVVDVQDIDFSGNKKFIFVQSGEAQRGVDAYEIMTLPFDKYLHDSDLRHPLNDLDQTSDINLSQRQIILHESNGACYSARMTYAAGSRQAPGEKLIEREQYSLDSDGVCYIEKYIPIIDPNGECQSLKLVSKKRAE